MPLISNTCSNNLGTRGQNIQGFIGKLGNDLCNVFPSMFISPLPNKNNDALSTSTAQWAN